MLFSEIFQVTGPIRRTAAFLAGHGYTVAVPEIFHELEEGPGVVLAYDAAGAERGNSTSTTSGRGRDPMIRRRGGVGAMTALESLVQLVRRPPRDWGDR